MERAVFDRMAEHDEAHWWYTARRDILARLIERHVPLPADARILEVGCGTGHNFGMLGRYGRVDALEIDEPARVIAQRRLKRPVGASPLPELSGIADGYYHLVALLDVLEHVADDHGALVGITRTLAPGGCILLTVPANPWMWSAHDVVHHHHRRYTAASLRRVATDAGLQVRMMTHFNTLLFPAAAAARIVGKLRGKTTSDDAMPGPALNALLGGVFGLERHLVGRVPLPFGISLAAILSAS